MQCLPKKNGLNFKEKYDAVSDDVVDFLKQCLMFNPNKRISVEDAMKHKIFDDIRSQELEEKTVEKITIDFEEQEIKSKEDLRKLYLEEVLNNN